MRRIPLTVLILLVSSMALAQTVSPRDAAIDAALSRAASGKPYLAPSWKDRVTLKGYYKVLGQDSKGYLEDDPYTSILQRMRLDITTRLNEAVSANMTWDNEITTGNVLRKADFQANKNASTGNFLDLSKDVMDHDDIFWRTTLYRAYVKYDQAPLLAVVGRQRISWSVGRLWETVDFFNPVSPIAIEPNQKTGVDALDVEWKFKNSARLETVYAPQSNARDTSVGSKLSTLVGEFDLAVLGGKFKKDRMVGVTFDGNINAGGLRGEASQVFADDDYNQKNFQRFDVGYDYTFANSFYILGEYLYNGGALNQSLLSVTGVQNQVLTRNKNSLGMMLGYDVTPLVRVENISLYDPRERSFTVMPTVKYSIVTNLDVAVGAQFFFGKDESEYGAYHDVYYGSVQWYF